MRETHQEKEYSKMENKILQPDTRWASFFGDISLEEFITKIPEIKFCESVNSNVKEAFEVIRKLLICSYYEYLFIDIAVARALHTLEMALKLRYSEVTGSQWGKNLESLIKWFRERGFFENDNPDFLDRIRGMRNHLSHPARHNIGGTVWFHWIDTVVNLINDLYDDVELRKERKLLASDFTARLTSFLQHGAKLNYGENFLLYGVGHVRVNNFVDPCLVQFSLLPTLNEDSGHRFPFIFLCDISKVDLESGCLTILDEAWNKYTLTNNLNSDEIESIEEYRGRLSADWDIIANHQALMVDSEKVLQETWRKDRHQRK